jgi:hypothetical protein
MVQAVFLSLLAAEVLVVGQGADAKRVLSEIRTALGGEEKVSAVKTVAIEGQVSRPAPNGTSSSSGFELAFELPDKFMKSDVFANLGGTELKRRSGFNGSESFEEMDAPPGMMGGGGMHIMRMSPGGATPGGQATPEQVEKQRAQNLQTSRREFARLALGMFGAAFAPLPLEFKYVGQAESQDGKADVLEVQGPDGFAAKLFVDSKSHLPLMLSWMDKEPLRMMVGPGGAGAAASGGGAGNVQVFTSASGGGGRMTQEEMAKMQQDMADRMKEAEAKRRVVEFRMFYGDYKAFGGVNLPTRIQRMTEGLPTEEMTFEKVKVNAKLDAAKFKVVK